MKKAKTQKVLIIPDQHIPYNNPIYWKFIMIVDKVVLPEIVIILGDFADFYSVSGHDKDPRRNLNIAQEVAEVKKHLLDLKSIKAKRYIYIAGNHEYRMERNLMQKDPQMFLLFSKDGEDPTKNILELDKLGFEYIPYRKGVEVGKVFFTHDLGLAGKFAHYRSYDNRHGNIVIGHTHTIGYAIQGDSRGERHVCTMLGWGGSKGYIDYMNEAKIAKDWSLGFGIGLLEEGGTMHIQPVPVIKYSCYADGKLYTVDDINLFKDDCEQH